MIRARKRFGQHFLERAWGDKVIRAIDPQRGETFVEIGPGRGALTRPLAARSKAVIACEIDRDLAAQLRADQMPNVTVVEGDFLETAGEVGSMVLQEAARGSSAVRVAGNLPYNVASPILFRLAALHAAGTPILDATVMLQREVARRLTAAPGSREYGALSVLLQHVSDPVVLLALPPGAFRPAPKVHSAVVRLIFHAPQPPVADPAVFADVVQAAFAHRRKTLDNALKGYMYRGREPFSRKRLPTPVPVPIDGRRRPETLSVAEFARLADFYAVPR